MTTLKELKDIVDALFDMAKGSSDEVHINFRTFDEKFDENADEFQEPDTITSVEFDILNWDKATITIERRSGENPCTKKARIFNRTQVKKITRHKNGLSEI